MRAVLYLAVNLRFGWKAGLSAAATDIMLRLTTSGVYGSLIESFRRVQPGWQAALATMVLLPVVSHAVEYAVHTWRGTADVKSSLIASITFTVLSTLFNLYAMQKGVLIVGEGRQPLSSDLRRMPRVLAGFLLVVPRALWQQVRR